MKSSSKTLMILSLLWLTVLLCIGGWWIYLMLNFETILASLDKISFSKMLFWEGSTFIILLILLSGSLLILYLKDQKRTKALQDFFASLTHELKTPLASIKLQGDVISELIESKNDPQLLKLVNRLTSDTIKLETQMDKILQLSRIERGGKLNLSNVKLIPFIKTIAKPWQTDFKINISCSKENIEIQADEFALELIFKNLFENTKKHSGSKSIDLKIEEQDLWCMITYTDQGNFNGEFKKLATLFYKHNSTKGSGIGLYLIKKLTEKMNGRFRVSNHQHLTFELMYLKAEDKNA